MDERSLGFIAAALLCASVAHAQAGGESPNALSRSIFQELIEINTTDSVGNVTTAAEAMARRLRAAVAPRSSVSTASRSPMSSMARRRFTATIS
jgi:hypothetical protein